MRIWLSRTPLLFSLYNLLYHYFLSITIPLYQFIFYFFDLHNTFCSIFCQRSFSQLKVPQDMEQSICHIYDIFTVLIYICSKIPFSQQFFHLYIETLHNMILFILFLLYILIKKGTLEQCCKKLVFSVFTPFHFLFHIFFNYGTLAQKNGTHSIYCCKTDKT